ncbi:MAG: cyclic-di-AMP receptor [Abditibacteriota bacterium]|nr:cyclic-di-AMP receptor [Abditibacteriota bacterium]
MKLIIAIVHERDRQDICDLLLENNWRFTVVASTGGFLREGKSTLLIGAEDDQVDNILEVIKSASSSREQIMTQPPMDLMGGAASVMAPVRVRVGGAVMFVVNVEQFEKA